MGPNRSGEMLLAMIMGFAVGAVTGLLVAPYSGTDTRRRIGSTAKRLQGEAEEKYTLAKRYVAQTAGDVREAVEAGRDAYQNARVSPKGGKGTTRKEPELVEPSVGS